MMVLQDTLTEEQMNDEEEDLNNSLREAVQDEAVKPKLQCLMMDPSFSMVTVQSEDSGIVWETASSRCSTPWASEMNVTPPEPGYTLSSPGTAGRIVVTMDEELTTRRERKKQKQWKAFPYTSDEIMRPAMVEVSLPNVTQTQDKTTETKEEKHQRLFSLVSEGSEILNIIAPPKVSTVDEEESKGLEDCLFYLEAIPAIKSQKIPDEPVNIPAEAEETPAADVVTSFIAEPIVPVPTITGSRRTAEDYFEKFTLLDTQTPSGEAAVEEDPGDTETEDTITPNKDDAPEPSSGLSRVPSAISMLDIPGEHLDDVFYGGSGSEPHSHDKKKEERGELSKSLLKESGSALFGSEEMVLTPIYLPEGPPKIIDPNLLEEPKAMAFLYSDLYADAVGSRKKQDDDTDSLTSEKSFHSQESDSEDRGYLEKFVLKVETLNVADGDREPEVRSEERQDLFRLAGYVEQPKTEVEMKTDELEEITDFFRSSASSSPCEAVDLYQSEPVEKPKVVRTTRVAFKAKKIETESRVEGSNSLPITDDIESAEAFLPVEISEDCPAWEENLQTFNTTTASTRTNERKNKPKSVSKTPSPKTSQTINITKPIIPCYKPFLDLSPLLPAEPEDEEQQTEGENMQEDKSGSEETTSPEAKAEDETTECLPPPPPDV